MGWELDRPKPGQGERGCRSANLVLELDAFFAAAKAPRHQTQDCSVLQCELASETLHSMELQTFDLLLGLILRFPDS
jgi:hypothetical protein